MMPMRKMPNRMSFLTGIGILTLLMPTVMACSSQATPPLSGPSAVQSLAMSEPVADTPDRSAESASTAPVQTVSEPTPLISVDATARPKADVEFLMTAALNALVDQDGPPDDPRSIFRPTWASELRQAALQMSRSGNTAYIPLIIDFMRIQFSKGGRTEYGSYLTSLAGEDHDDIPKVPRDWGLWVEWLGKHPEVQAPKS